MVRVPVLLLLTLCRTRTKAEPQCLVTIPIRAQECHQQRVASIHWRYVNTLRRFCFQGMFFPRQLITVSTVQVPALRLLHRRQQRGAAGSRGHRDRDAVLDVRHQVDNSFCFFRGKSMTCIARLCNVRYPEQCLCV